MDKDYGFFEYKITFFDNYAIDEDHKWGQLKTVYGVVYAVTFKEAMEKIKIMEYLNIAKIIVKK